MAVDLFGWDLIFRSVETELRKKEDLLVAFTHWFLIKNGLLCIGNGNSKTLTGEEVKSEALTSGWNPEQKDYYIRYIYDGRLYLLRAAVTGEDIIFNFLRADDLCISCCVFKIEDTVKDYKGDISTCMPNYKNIIGTLRRDLLDPVFSKSTTSAAETQTPNEEFKVTNRRCEQRDRDTDHERDPLRVPPRRPQPTPQMDPFRDPLADPLSVGRSDLHPFGSGGGMIFDPFGSRAGRRDPIGPGPSFPGGLPRGAVPPGARFDPVSPPGIGRGGRRTDPDPDHLPPPGYDDMFM